MVGSLVWYRRVNGGAHAAGAYRQVVEQNLTSSGVALKVLAQIQVIFVPCLLAF
jgi:hypothetical protein